jgi:hypothetical protein
VRLAAFRCGFEDFDDYLVLGDDVTIASKIVGEEYIKILNLIGVDVSLSKTVKRTNGMTAIEFASQLIVESEVYSPLPLGLVIEGSVERLFSL